MSGVATARGPGTPLSTGTVWAGSPRRRRVDDCQMAPDLVTLLLFAADDGPGRGENASGAGGVLMVVGIAFGLLALALLVLLLTGQLSRLRAGVRRPLREGYTDPNGPEASD